MRHVLPCLLLPLCLSAPATAAELAGVKLPDRVEVGGASLVLNGLGLREATFLKVDVYVAGLYLPKKTTDAAAILRSPGPKQVVQHFVRDVDRKDMVELTRKGFERNSPDLMPKVRGRMDRLLGMLPDVKEGDRITLTHHAGRVAVTVNGKQKGEIEGDDFAQALFSAWLGPHPPNPGLKSGMLGR